MVRLLQMVLRGLVIFFDRVLPILLKMASFMVWAMFIALTAVWVGWDRASDRISYEWMKEAAGWGLPSSLDPLMHSTTRILAFALILFGWVLLAHATVWGLWYLFAG